LTGRVFYSSNIINKTLGHDLELCVPYLDSNINNIISNMDQKYLGLNALGYSKYIKYAGLESYNNKKNINLKSEIAKKYDCNVDNILFHNGILNFLSKITNVFVKKNHEIMCFDNSWSVFDNIIHDKIVKNDYSIEKNISYFSYNVPDYKKMKNDINGITRMLYFVGPLNKDDFENFIKNIPKNIIIVVDFCYDDYVNYEKNLKMNDCLNYENPIISINTFSKFYGLPAINLSFSISNIELKDILSYFFYYDVNNITEEIAIKALRDVEHQKNVEFFYKNEIEKFQNLLENKQIKFKIPTPISMIIYTKINIPNNLRQFLFYDNDGNINIVINNKENNMEILKFLNEKL
jgi:histidinol-phosphate/aromatic aminotransferase/cobyric acid decarboxylase-like protein